LERFNPSLNGPEQLWMKKQSQRLNTSKKLNDYNLAYIHLSEPFTDVSAYHTLLQK
jgi:N-ethylmaleimide reductase